MGRTSLLAGRLARGLLYALAVLLILAGAGLSALRTQWGKDRLRDLIVRQANQYLTATLQIGRLEGSLFGGIDLGDVRLSRDGQTLVSIDRVSVSYSLRELFGQGTAIRRIRLERPRVAAARLPDGRWNLAALVRRTAPQNASGPRRPLHLGAVEVTDGRVSVEGPLTFGFTKLPTLYEDLNLALSFDYAPSGWRLEFQQASWQGHAPDLTVSRITGNIAQNGDGWTLEQLLVESPRSRVVVDGGLDRRVSPSRLDLRVDAQRFLFNEWSGAVSFLANIAVDARFVAHLIGPVKRLAIDLSLQSNGGNATGPLVLDTTSPGWSTAGTLDLERLDLARWLSRPDDASDISGRVSFDITTPPGARFPRGTYTFDGSHAAFAGYEGDDVKARGRISAARVEIAEATATAYGANVRVDSGTIGVSSPYPFTFAGVADGADLRLLPPAVPVPHVESRLRFAYDVAGRFSAPFLTGRAAFRESEFLGIVVGEGTVGEIDTSQHPFRYSGDGDLSQVDLNRVGTGLSVAWLADPRYAGTVAGHFHVAGTGADLATMALTGGGRLTRADIFGGRLTDANVDIGIHDGSLTGSYDGALSNINPAIALADPRYDASLSGAGQGRIAVRDVLLRSPALADYTIGADLTLGPSRVRAVALDRADLSASLDGGTLDVARFRGVGPALDLEAAGRVEVDGQRSSALDYSIARADLGRLRDLTGRDLQGELTTSGRMTGPASRVRLVGDGTLAGAGVAGVTIEAARATYDASIPTGAPARFSGRIDGRLLAVDVAGQHLKEATGVVTYDDGQATADVHLVRGDGMAGAIAGRFVLRPDQRTLDALELTATVEHSSWRLAAPSARLTWTDEGIGISGLVLADADTGDQRFTADGTWLPRGGGTLHLTARRVALDALAGGDQGPARYGGIVDADVTVRGTREAPLLAGQLSIVDGRVARTPYEKVAGTFSFAGSTVQVDMRLDQSPGVWLTAVGSLPAAIALGQPSDESMNLALVSSTVSLSLIEGVTNVVRNVGGQAQLNVRLVGTPRDPHFDGRVELSDASFLVASSGARYRNGRALLQLTPDRVTVSVLHLEDAAGHALDVSGSLATHQLRVGDLAVDVTARGFEVMRNEFGRVDVDAVLQLRGQFESPRVDGQVTITRGELAVDAILDRTLFRPYATAAAAVPETDAIVALNPWERLGIGIELHVPGTLRLVGDNLQIAAGTPLGLGAVNLRALGDLYLYKDPADVLYVLGSLDSVTGTYAFQGRRFDLDPSSSINFHGDLSPEPYVIVRREISGVDTRVTISGSLSAPELQLTSNPPLDSSDILSLIVFGTSMNQLSATQQQQLAVRAGSIAAGFLAAPILTAIERSLGLDTLEIEPGASADGGTRVTIGNEIAPGLVARFSRQFGASEYDEAVVEYYLSRILRIRATFSDATGLAARSPFRRVERAGIDFLVFFSF